MTQKTLWLGAGHSPTSGGTSSDGLLERQVNVQVTDKVYTLLQERGLLAGVGGVVLIPHEHDLHPSIQWVKAQNANRVRGDIAIELHLQGHSDKSQRGAFVLYGKEAENLARTLMDEYAARGLIGQWRQGIFRSTTAAKNWRGWDDYGWNKGLDPQAFTLIFEMGHLTNAQDAAIFGDPTRQQIQATAVAAGLYRIFTGQSWEVPGIFRAPSITLDQFRAILMQAASPLAEADIAYWLCSTQGVDPAFPLALFRHTSTYGNVGATVSARNPGLLSQGSDGVSFTVNLANLGSRQRYHAWLDGWRAMIHHLNVYHRSRNHQTVAEILADWDEGVDMGYLVADVEATMRGWA
jgi:N-acetylmuramoyl-L-alanine amidase